MFSCFAFERQPFLLGKNLLADARMPKVVSYAASGMDIDYGLLGAQPEVIHGDPLGHEIAVATATGRFRPSR